MSLLLSEQWTCYTHSEAPHPSEPHRAGVNWRQFSQQQALRNWNALPCSHWQWASKEQQCPSRPFLRAQEPREERSQEPSSLQNIIPHGFFFLQKCIVNSLTAYKFHERESLCSLALRNSKVKWNYGYMDWVRGCEVNYMTVEILKSSRATHLRTESIPNFLSTSDMPGIILYALKILHLIFTQLPASSSPCETTSKLSHFSF